MVKKLILELTKSITVLHELTRRVLQCLRDALVEQLDTNCKYVFCLETGLKYVKIS